MKKFRFLVALVLVAVMSLSLVGAAFAADDPTYTGSIKVTNTSTPASGSTTYEAYRIFDLKSTDPNDVFTYTINTDWSGFFTGTAAGVAYIVDTNDLTKNDGKGYAPIVVGGERKYIKLAEDNIEAFAKAALAYSQTAPVNPVTSNATGEFTGLALGYYMIYPKGASITPANGFSSIVSLTNNKPDAQIKQKATFPGLEKVDDDQSVELGQVVTYTLTSKVPDTTGYTTYSFTMHDQMTDGLTFDSSSIVVSIDGTSIGAYAAETNTKGYTYAAETAGEGYATAFKIDIPVMQWQDKVGETITVTYTARVNSNAVTQVEKNHATLEYSNNPKDSSSKTTTPPDEEKVFSAKIIINKYDGSNTAAKLQGAKFVLRCKKVTETTGTGTKPTATVGSYYKLTGAGTEASPYVATWVAETAVDGKVNTSAAALESDIANGATVVETDADGAASFNGLENGEYELIEVLAPAGYNQIKGVAATITVAGTDAATANIQYTANVANNAGTELPSTGGIGTTIFYVAGIVLVLGAAAIIIARRKAEQN